MTSRQKKKLNAIGSGFGFLAPNLLGFLVFVLFPVLFAFMLSFTKWSGTNFELVRFLGISSFTRVLKESDFWYYLGNTFIFMVGVPIGMAVSLGLALAMNQELKGIVFFRTVYFLPVISSLVAVALLWRWIYNADGLLNSILKGIGVSNPPNWLGSVFWARPAVIILDVWKGAGYNMLLYLAGLQGIPHHLYEAADIDGASGWQKFTNITFPLLAPTNFFMIIMGIIAGFQSFATQYVLTDGGPSGATTTIVFWIWRSAFANQNMGKAAAIAIILFAIMFVFTIIQWRHSESKVTY